MYSGFRVVASEVIGPVEETVQSGAAETLERQNRFVTDNLRRIFVQIYRIVGNVADAQDLTQETFIKALQRQEQLKDELKAAPKSPTTLPKNRFILSSLMDPDCVTADISASSNREMLCNGGNYCGRSTPVHRSSQSDAVGIDHFPLMEETRL